MDGADKSRAPPASLSTNARSIQRLDGYDTKIAAIREDMERAFARRLQPHFIQAFFLDAFPRLGGKVHRREEGRWEITHVPQTIRERDRHIGMGAASSASATSACASRRKRVDEQPRAELICPGTPTPRMHD